MGIRLLLHGEILIGAAGVGGGVTVAGVGTQLLINRKPPFRGAILVVVAVLGLGVALSGAGIGFMLDGKTLVGAGGLGAGAAVTSSGIALLLPQRYRVVWIVAAGLVGGVAVAVMGIGLLLHGETLIGLAAIGAGIACVGTGIRSLHVKGVWGHCRWWLTGQ